MVQVSSGDLDAEAFLLALTMLFKPIHLIIDCVEDRLSALILDLAILFDRKGRGVGLSIVVLPAVVWQELLEGFLPVECTFGDPSELLRRVLGLGVRSGRNMDMARGDRVRPQVEMQANGVKDGADLALPSPRHRHGRRDDLDAPCYPSAPG